MDRAKNYVAETSGDCVCGGESVGISQGYVAKSKSSLKVYINHNELS